MKCLLKYQWVKLPRNQMPPGKGIMGAWARMASRAAFRNGQAVYCGHVNHVTLGAWVGGVVGLKSILGIKRRAQAMEMVERLVGLDYIDFELNPRTKKLTYKIKDWVVNCSGAPCMGDEAVYATSGYGFLCLPRNITQRLAEAHYQFDEADAWLDLWCHTVWQDPDNAFSHMAPAVQYGRYGAKVSALLMGLQYPIHIGGMVSVDHEHQSKVEDFVDSLDMLFAQFGDSVTRLSNLLSVYLEYPVNAMTAVCKKLSMPKKAALEAIAMFEAVNGNDPATAHDVFMAMQEIPFNLKISGAPESKLLALQENMARALTLRWSDYDLAKKVNY